MISSDIHETRAEAGEPGLSYGVVMGRRDWLMIVCRFEPHLTGQRVGTCGRYAVACDTSMEPTAQRWYYSRDRFEEHVARLP